MKNKDQITTVGGGKIDYDRNLDFPPGFEETLAEIGLKVVRKKGEEPKIVEKYPGSGGLPDD